MGSALADYDYADDSDPPPSLSLVFSRKLLFFLFFDHVSKRGCWPVATVIMRNPSTTAVTLATVPSLSGRSAWPVSTVRST